MAVTLQQVRAYLDVDEPAYREAARLGVDALPHLETLVEGPDTLLAAKAAYLAGLIDGARSLPVLTRAARSADKVVRSAAAAAAAHLQPETAASVLVTLLGDTDAEVRRIALDSIPTDVAPALRGALERIAGNDPYTALRQRSTEILARRR